ncbi:MAG: hypothetical protein NTX97_08180 [Bacteroidetes bacterium]|nr:hypothetical protein [Bacteroidota bacterium]
MKNYKLAFTSFLTIIALVIGANRANAQKAYFNSKTSRQVVNQETLVFTCEMQELKSKDAAVVLATKMRATKAVTNVEVKDYNVNKANFVISTPKKQGLLSLQKALLGAGIETVYLDSKPIKTSELAQVVRAMKKK